ncbi:hypothetical protein EDB85DRAFT_2145599 [Lactarius pseudohatsudake]|nr:hypothetical protein EDB85DRAFT_2145599 [Lactarius pseudohatsudake]
MTNNLWDWDSRASIPTVPCLPYPPPSPAKSCQKARGGGKFTVPRSHTSIPAGKNHDPEFDGSTDACCTRVLRVPLRRASSASSPASASSASSVVVAATAADLIYHLTLAKQTLPGLMPKLFTTPILNPRRRGRPRRHRRRRSPSLDGNTTARSSHTPFDSSTARRVFFGSPFVAPLTLSLPSLTPEGCCLLVPQRLGVPFSRRPTGREPLGAPPPLQLTALPWTSVRPYEEGSLGDLIYHLTLFFAFGIYTVIRRHLNAQSRAKPFHVEPPEPFHVEPPEQADPSWSNTQTIHNANLESHKYDLSLAPPTRHPKFNLFFLTETPHFPRETLGAALDVGPYPTVVLPRPASLFRRTLQSFPAPRSLHTPPRPPRYPGGLSFGLYLTSIVSRAPFDFDGSTRVARVFGSPFVAPLTLSPPSLTPDGCCTNGSASLSLRGGPENLSALRRLQLAALPWTSESVRPSSEV